jgi:hypothetical protein
MGQNFILFELRRRDCGGKTLTNVSTVASGTREHQVVVAPSRLCLKQRMALPTAARARLVGLAERILGTRGVSAQDGNNIMWG